jgi:toxoflavin synthase
MAAEYDQFPGEYKKSKQLPFRAYIEAPMLFGMLGDVSGLTVLDLACGEGHYTRMIRRRGAARVVGVDLSGEMIALAKSQEAGDPLGIEYIHSSAQDLRSVGPFDVVTAAYLLNYARDRDDLAAMCHTIAANLKPGGRFVGVNGNFGPGVPPDISQYGWMVSDPSPIEEGAAYPIKFLLGPDAFTIINYYHSRPIYEDEFRRAGFGSVRWHSPDVSRAGVQEFGAEFWRRFLEVQPIIGIECQIGSAKHTG